ncbi:hypothetical protein AVEN_212212-1 [Araneus ventricosus]|uniref:Uncharacterized protein n=1 Tax=Araneus ventricosus TaxID=182803 RepID=A0A4Y2HTA6_ARAVE|nr:hypothetical protein AVEN_212212-1 [Araneus ventricosus]
MRSYKFSKSKTDRLWEKYTKLLLCHSTRPSFPNFYHIPCGKIKERKQDTLIHTMPKTVASTYSILCCPSVGGERGLQVPPRYRLQSGARTRQTDCLITITLRYCVSAILIPLRSS